MKVHPKFESGFSRISAYFATVIRIVMNALLVVAIAALIAGVGKAGYDLATSLHEPLETILQHILLDVVFIVAVVEITLTILGYLKDGYVHVRYIVDTVLIIMLNEVVNIWFTRPDLQKSIGLSIILATLAGVRIAVTRFAPTPK